MYRIIFFLFLCILVTDDLQIGIDSFNNRALNAKALIAEPTNINKAIEIFEKRVEENKTLEMSAEYLIKSLNFKGRFVAQKSNEKKIIFSKAINVGNKYLKYFPKNGCMRFELISSIGLLAEQNGLMKSAEEGVLKQMVYHTELLIKYDSMYNAGGGWKTLAVMHYKTPNIPLVLDWPNKKTSLVLLKKALHYFPANIPNNFYYAEALMANGDKTNANIYFQLVLKLAPRKDCVLEDEFFKIKTRKYFEGLKK